MSVRLLIVGPLPPPPGGGETVTKVLIQSDLRHRYDLRHFDITRRQTKEDMGRFTLLNALWGVRYLRGLERLLGEFKPRLVHIPIASARAPMLRDRLFAAAIRRSGARLIMHQHSGLFEDRYRDARPYWQRFTRHFLGMADLLICLSPRWQRFFDELELGVRTVVVPNPVDPEFQAAIDAAPASSGRGLRVLFVGAVCEPKGVPELLEALDVLMEEQPELRGRIVGGKQYPGHFERIVARHAKLAHRDRIVITGPIFDEALAAEYRAADLLVLPSHFEAMPLVLVEAMTAGVPVVATRVGGIPDVVADGENGLLVEPRDVAGLVGAMRTLLEDDAFREAIGRRNREQARRLYGAQHFAETCDGLYQSLLEG